MSLRIAALLLAFAGVIGMVLGYYLRLIISLGKKGSMEIRIKQMMLDAQEEAKRITLEAEKKSLETMKDLRSEIKEKDEKLKKTEERLIKKEDLLDKRQVDIDREVESIKEKITEIRAVKEKTEKLQEQKLTDLEKISRLSENEAKNELIALVEKKHEEDIAIRLKKLEASGTDRLEQKAKEILTTAIQRLGNSVSSDVMATSVAIPGDEVKGKIIGKEGRNIKAFERATGVELIVDDTPGSITISSFN